MITKANTQCETSQIKKNTSSDELQIKIVDFGISCIKKESYLNEETGTAYYIASEVIKNNYTEKRDMWSLRVIMYILLSVSTPFSDHDDEEILKISWLDNVLKKAINGWICQLKQKI